MNAKNRLLSSLTDKTFSPTAAAPLYLHLYLAADVRRYALERYDRWLGGMDEREADPALEVAIQTDAIRSAWESLGETPDWIWTSLMPTAQWLSECVLRREGDCIWRVHRPSGKREDLSDPFPSTDSTDDLWHKEPPGSVKVIDDLIPLTPAETMIDDGRLAGMSLIVKMMGSDTFVYGKMGSPFWKCYSLLGFQGLMTMPLEQPSLFRHIIERQTSHSLSLARAYASTGIHGVFIEECLTSADLISPRIYDEFVYPYDKALLDEFRSLGIPAILYVTGDVNPRLQRIAALAPAALAVEESKKGFELDLEKIAQAIGENVALFGNLDATRVKDWSSAELAVELEKQKRVGSLAQGFVHSIGSPFPLETPKEKVRAFIKTARSI